LAGSIITYLPSGSGSTKKVYRPADPDPKEIFTDPQHWDLIMSVFRVLCLWGVAQWWEERENDKPPSSLTTLLLANQGRVLYPQYSIIRCDFPTFRLQPSIFNEVVTSVANPGFLFRIPDPDFFSCRIRIKEFDILT
jgi:hypothetical protein